MTTDATLYETAGGVARITLNRPENRNALSADLVNGLFAHLEAANRDADVRCIVLTGAGTAFCAGADLKNPPGSPVGDQRPITLPEVIKAILDSPKPVIVAVNGPALAGGMGLVAAADICIAAEDAPMGFTEVRIGVIPAVISVVCIPKLGVHQAMKLMLTGERFAAKDAVGYGLVHRAVPADQLRAAVQEELDKLMLAGPIALRECKRLVRRISSIGLDDGFTEAAPWSVRMFQSEEGQEGMAAFREKRKPKWVTPD